MDPFDILVTGTPLPRRVSPGGRAPATIPRTLTRNIHGRETL
jgi:hypothetical protein